MGRKHKRKYTQEHKITNKKNKEDTEKIWFPIEIIEYILSFISNEEHCIYKLVCKHWYQYFKNKIKYVVTRYPNKMAHFYPNLEKITIKQDTETFINLNFSNMQNLKTIILYNFNFSKITFHINKNIIKHKIDLHIFSDYYNGNCLKPIFDQIIEHEFIEKFYINSKSSFCAHCKILYSLIPIKQLYLENCRHFEKDIIKNIINNENIEKLYIDDVVFSNLPAGYYIKILRMPKLKEFYINRKMLTSSEIDYFTKYQEDAKLNMINPFNKEKFINVYFL